jgi:RNA polymerase sigma-70 factor (ECF subfamily)
MSQGTTDERWRRLIELLEPFHQQALATSRRLCRSSADGDDLYQEAVLRAFDKLHTLRDPSRFRSWFYATLLSRHRDRYRRSFWKRFLPLEEAFPTGDPAGEDGSGWDVEALRSRRAAQALASLPAEQREAIVLFEIEQYSIEEIATMQSASVPAVKSRLTRGRERLRRFYQRLGVEPSPRGRKDAGGWSGAAAAARESAPRATGVASSRERAATPLPEKGACS